MFKEVLWKDLKHSFRDKDVFIYTFIVPALLYPSLLIGSAEMVMFKNDSERTKAIKYVISSPGDAGLQRIDQILSKMKRFKRVQSEHPEQDLSDGAVDAVLARKFDNGAFVELQVNQLVKVVGLASEINVALKEQYREEVKQAFADKGLKDNLIGFNVVSKNITDSGLTQKVSGSPGSKAGRNQMENISAPLCLIIFSLLMLGLGAAYPAIAVTAEEFERNTIETSCLLPVSRSIIMLGKLASVTTFAALSGLVNFSSMYSVALLMLTQAKMFPNLSGDYLSFHLSAAQAFGLAVAYVLLAVQISASMIFATSFCRTVRSAQQWTTIPLFIILVLPPLALFPNLELNKSLMWVPILNCTLMLKAIFTGMPFNIQFVIVTIITLAVITIELSLARVFLFEQVDPGAYLARRVDNLSRLLKRGTNA